MIGERATDDRRVKTVPSTVGTEPALMIAGLAVLLFVAAAGASQTATAPPARSTRVLFMCPHGAAKSVLASAYFRRLAEERGLNVIVESAGTEPDETVSPAVAAHLSRQGYPIPAGKPRLATAADLRNADVVISLGCDVTRLPAPVGTLKTWDDVPPLDADFARGDEAIRRHVAALVEELHDQVKARGK